MVSADYASSHTYMYSSCTVPASAPVNIESSTVTSTMVEISWDPLPSEDENGIVRHYLINVTEIQTGNTFQTPSSRVVMVKTVEYDPEPIVYTAILNVYS